MDNTILNLYVHVCVAVHISIFVCITVYIIKVNVLNKFCIT